MGAHGVVRETEAQVGEEAAHQVGLDGVSVPVGDLGGRVLVGVVAHQLCEAPTQLLWGEWRQLLPVGEYQRLAGLDGHAGEAEAQLAGALQGAAGCVDHVQAGAVQVGGVVEGDGEDGLVGEVSQLAALAAARAAVAQELDGLGQTVVLAGVALDEVPAAHFAQKLQALELAHQGGPRGSAGFRRQQIPTDNAPAGQELVGPLAHHVNFG